MAEDMTEEEWLSCLDPYFLWGHLDQKISARKYRLYCVTSLRRIEHLLLDLRFRNLINVVEEVTEGTIPEYNFEIAVQSIMAIEQGDRFSDEPHQNAIGQASRATKLICDIHAAWDFSDCVISAIHEESEDQTFNTFELEQAIHVRFIRDLFGNPFREVFFDPHWLTQNVVDLAQTIYEDRSFENMSILADALMDTGCNNDIPEHCRLLNDYIRGCWVIDPILGKS